MTRYLRLYINFLRFSFSRAMEFRLDFYFRIFMDVIYYVVNILFFKIIFLNTPFLAGWTEEQVMVFVSVFIMIDAINMTVFANNMWMLTVLINKGDLDYYLVRPVSTLFFVSLRDFAANSFINLIITLGIMVWALNQYPEPLGFVNLLLFFLLILNGTFLYFLVRFLFVLPVFWTHSNRGLDPIFWGLTKFMERPHSIYKGVMQIVLRTILPFAVMASIPTQILFSKNPLPMTGVCLLTSACFFILILQLWKFALRNYSSASS